MTMFVEVDVEVGDNCDYPLNRVFSALTVSTPVSSVETIGIRGDLAMFEVTGWCDRQPCQAYSVIVEDSGEGQAILIYGGVDGIRLRPKGSETPWSLEAADQWGEPCLLLDQSTQIET